MNDSQRKAINLCNCNKCKLADKCAYINMRERLPSELFMGAKSRCPKVKNERF